MERGWVEFWLIFGSIWLTLTHFDSIWINLAHFGKLGEFAFLSRKGPATPSQKNPFFSRSANLECGNLLPLSLRRGAAFSLPLQVPGASHNGRKMACEYRGGSKNTG